MSDAELAALHLVADWIRDEVEENGYLVTKGIKLHPAFDETDGIASAMLRGLVVSGARDGARLGALTPTRAHNGWDLIWSEEGLYRKYRIKKATKSRSGAFEMLVGANSALVKLSPESLISEEQWVLGFTVTASRDIDDVFAAKILGVTGRRVQQLVLSAPIILGTGSTLPSGGKFVSAEEDFLPGFEDDPSADDADGSVA